MRLAWTLLETGVTNDPEAVHLVSAWNSGRLRRLQLDEIYPGIERCGVVSIRNPERRVVGFALDLQELVHLLSIIKITDARRILEVGTFDGFTALNVAANLADGGEVCTVDLPQDREQFRAVIANTSEADIVGSQFLGEVEKMRIKQIWADSTTTDWATFGPPFDLILIDGAHEYPYVKSDSLNAVKHVHPGGTVLWHDYGYMRDVSKAVDEMANCYSIVAIKGTRLACYRKPPSL